MSEPRSAASREPLHHAAGGTTPLIAVTTSEIRAADQTPPTPEGEPAQAEMVLGLKYMHAIEAGGGLPVVVPPLSHGAIDSLLDRVSGLCLSGGPDLHPAAYLRHEHVALGPTWPELDEFELELIRAADLRDMPILAICRGLQVLNVARGGTLHQHLPDLSAEITHRQPEPGHQTTHWIRLTGPSRLAGILRRRRTRVNSFHHQAVDGLGANLSVTSHAPDGTIESLESNDGRFVVGVQWHAECLIRQPAQLAIFEAFVEAAAEFDGARGRGRAALGH
ncbi:MAG TPA: gamma-glutamyl-gamma-aminobutyrate hydrolase family protein [Solirubrobacteraceae bacterium]|jgi:putative glutamine amidotransferase|nr:gamma-glutamyl-gamma-aminobutyrate hydrolase family protein [Solirubrobacteraceae bacterium]